MQSRKLEVLRCQRQQLTLEVKQAEREHEQLTQGDLQDLHLKLGHYQTMAASMRQISAEYDYQIVYLEQELESLETCLLDIQEHHIKTMGELSSQVMELRRALSAKSEFSQASLEMT